MTSASESLLVDDFSFEAEVVFKMRWLPGTLITDKVRLYFVILQKTRILINVHYFISFLQAAKQIKLLYKLFLKVDATQVEINPFGETLDGKGGLIS